MPGFLTDHVNNQVLDCFFGGRAIAPPSTLYAGLSASKASRGGAISEPRGGGYARVAVPNDLESFAPAAFGAKSNLGPIRFPAATDDWGPIVSLFLADSAAGGRVLAMADLPEARVIGASGRPLTVAAAGLFLSHR